MATLLFEDNFDGTSLNTSIWTPGWFGTGITGPVGDTCLDSNLVSIAGDSCLHLKLVANPSTCRGTTSQYTGSLISSNPYDGVVGHTGFQYTYGYIEFRAYLPGISGQIANWPALWTDGQNWPTDGENDTMEGLGGRACFHFHSSAGGPGGCASGDYTGWHIFGSDWKPGVVTYYYDNVQVGQITSGITSVPQYIIMNLASGSGPGLAPSEMLVDYVRIWDSKPTTIPLSVSLTINPAIINLGQSTTITAAVTGGVPPYNYAWSGLPTGCLGGNTNKISCTPTSIGTFDISVTVTDSSI